MGAALVALACVGASARRLAWAVAPTALDPSLLSKALGKEIGRGRGADFVGALARSTRSEPRLAWEHDLFAAFGEPEGPGRDALLNEHLLEFEGRIDRWGRVPRVCASIGTSAGLLFGTIALLQGLDAPAGDDGAGAIHAAMAAAFAALSLGIAGTAFCVTVHVRAGRGSRAGRAAMAELVAALERGKQGERSEQAEPGDRGRAGR
jgi:hypothetical protein